MKGDSVLRHVRRHYRKDITFTKAACFKAAGHGLYGTCKLCVGECSARGAIDERRSVGEPLCALEHIRR
jgi:hypothetical protein